MTPTEKLDALMKTALTALAADPHVRQWRAKENNWVSYFAFKYLVSQCRPDGILTDPAQIGVEVSVPQAPGRRTRGVCRDIVIWPAAGMTAWVDGWEAAHHPMAIIEWKVHIRGRKKRKRHLIVQERQWLKDYCSKNNSVLGYAVEVDGTETKPTMKCWRFLGEQETPMPWLTFELA